VSWSQLVAAVRRFALFLVGAAGATIVVSLVIGVIAGRPARAVSLGLYVVGAVLLVGSFVVGNRGPLRPVWGDGARPGSLFAPRGLRRASAQDRAQSVRSSAFLFGIGFGLIVLGALLDPAHRAV